PTHKIRLLAHGLGAQSRVPRSPKLRDIQKSRDDLSRRQCRRSKTKMAAVVVVVDGVEKAEAESAGINASLRAEEQKRGAGVNSVQGGKAGANTRTRTGRGTGTGVAVGDQGGKGGKGGMKMKVGDDEEVGSSIHSDSEEHNGHGDDDDDDDVNDGIGGSISAGGTRYLR
ncbi:hypothetical protein F5Y08DRAFT_172488, partial [Xylaria arbuscula]